ncbi:MAG: 23S rRNA pseudouridine(2604) synthase RluF [Marinagarivorans sp.]
MHSQSSTRLNKFISESGICSRREADRLIEQGKVYINGRKAKIGDVVRPGDKVNADGQWLEEKTAEDFIFIAFNKPVGITSTTEMSDKTNIIDYINHSQRIFPIGRLDKDSQGLIFLTNDGDIVNKILRAGNKHEKEYLVTVNKPITKEFIAGMGDGVPILGEMTKKCLVTQESPFVFRIVLIQGLNRQIRRMCEYFGYEVTKLERVRIMNIRLKGLPLGDWRDLDEDEIASIFKMLEHSSSEGSPRTRSAPPAKKPQRAKTAREQEYGHRASSPHKPTQTRPTPNSSGAKKSSAPKAAGVASKPASKTKAFTANTDKTLTGNKATVRSADWRKLEAAKLSPATGVKSAKFTPAKAGAKPAEGKSGGAKNQYTANPKSTSARQGTSNKPSPQRHAKNNKK